MQFHTQVPLQMQSAGGEILNMGLMALFFYAGALPPLGDLSHDLSFTFYTYMY